VSDPSKQPQTPSQTIGPYFAIGLNASQSNFESGSLVSNEISGDGELITITGQVFDGEGEVVNDAMIEILQADSSGLVGSEHFLGFARADTGIEADNSFVFRTIKPGAVSSDEAPYISDIVHMRGLLLQTYTRLYFSDEEAANLNDVVFSQLTEDRRETLIAQRTQASDRATYQFDIHMQGDRETLFFSV
jgi:protocatechuate 3,4-dioxygenase alpha subunit